MGLEPRKAHPSLSCCRLLPHPSICPAASGKEQSGALPGGASRAPRCRPGVGKFLSMTMHLSPSGSPEPP